MNLLVVNWRGLSLAFLISSVCTGICVLFHASALNHIWQINSISFFLLQMQQPGYTEILNLHMLKYIFSDLPISKLS